MILMLNAENIYVVDDLGRIVWSKNYNGQTNYIYELLDAADMETRHLFFEGR